MTSTTEEELRLRLDTLEAMYHELLNVKIDEGRLAVGVERLTDETAGLNNILTQVDEQQRRLSGLTRKLEKVEDETARKEHELERSVRLERHQRRLVGLLLLAGLLVTVCLVVYVSDSAHNACENRQAATRANIDVLKSFKRGDPRVDQRLDDGVMRLMQTLKTTCDEQYPFHL